MKRMAFANVERGLPLFEWELGSRVVADLSAENFTPITEPVLQTRIGRALKGAAERIKLQRMELLEQFIGCQITILDDKDSCIYFVDEVSKYKLDLRCQQVWPEPQDKDKNGKPYTYKVYKYFDPEEIDQAWNWQKMMMYDGRRWIVAPPWEWSW